MANPDNVTWAIQDHLPQCNHQTSSGTATISSYGRGEQCLELPSQCTLCDICFAKHLPPHSHCTGVCDCLQAGVQTHVCHRCPRSYVVWHTELSWQPSRCNIQHSQSALRAIGDWGMPHSLFIQRTSWRATYSCRGYHPTSRTKFHNGVEDLRPSRIRKKDMQPSSCCPQGSHPYSHERQYHTGQACTGDTATGDATDDYCCHTRLWITHVRPCGLAMARCALAV